MTNQTTQTTGDTVLLEGIVLPAPPRMPGGQEMYDIIMRKIEPELCSDALAQLKAKYDAETPDQKKVRADRYRKAFMTYDQHLSAYFMELEKQVHSYERHAFAAAEQSSQTKEKDMLQHLESQLSS